MMQKIVAGFLLSFLSTFSFSASFDCSKAATKVEKMICGDELLSKLDEHLGDSYKVGLDKSPDVNGLKREQLEWLKTRNSCEHTDCLTHLYHIRIGELDYAFFGIKPSRHALQNPSLSSASNSKQEVVHKFPLTFKLIEGSSYPVCTEYVEMLNATKYMEVPACERRVLPTYSQFKSVEWEEVTDRKEMKRILEKRLAISYASNKKLVADEVNDANLKASLFDLENAINLNRIKLYMTKIDIDGDKVLETVYRENFSVNSPQNSNFCSTKNALYFDDDEITLANAEMYRSPKGYQYFSGGDYYIFSKDGVYYLSSWSGGVEHYDIDISSLSVSAKCKIVIQ